MGGLAGPTVGTGTGIGGCAAAIGRAPSGAGVAVAPKGGRTTVGAKRGLPVGVAAGATGAAVSVGGPAVGVGSSFHGTGVGVACASSVIGAALGPHAVAATISPIAISQRTPAPESTLVLGCASTNDCARRTGVLRFRTLMAAHGASKRSRDKHLAAAVANIEKKFGVGALQRLGSRANTHVDVLPTPIPELDSVLGVSGWPRGRICEIFGPEGVGSPRSCCTSWPRPSCAAAPLRLA